MIGKLITAVMAGAVLAFFTVFATLMGAFSGWVVGWFFADTILPFFSYIFGAAHGFQMWEIGASLGFIGSFFRVRVMGGGIATAKMKDWWMKRKAIAEAQALAAATTKPTIVRG